MSDGRPATPAMAEAAELGLKLRELHGRGGLTTQEAGALGIGSGVARARDIKNGVNLSADTWQRIASFHARNASNAKARGSASRGYWGDTANPSAGYIAHLLWGGDTAADEAAQVLGLADNPGKRLTLPLESEPRPWSGRAARKDLAEYAQSRRGFDWAKFGRGFLYAPEGSRNKSDYKLPIANVYRNASGRLVLRANERAIEAAAAVLEGARGGVDMPATARARARHVVELYYKRMGQQVPWPPFGPGTPNPEPEQELSELSDAARDVSDKLRKAERALRRIKRVTNDGVQLPLLEVESASELAATTAEKESDLTPPTGDGMPAIAWSFVDPDGSIALLMLRQASGSRKAQKRIEAAAKAALDRVQVYYRRRSGDALLSLKVGTPRELGGRQSLLMVLPRVTSGPREKAAIDAMRDLTSAQLADAFTESWVELFGQEALASYVETHWGEMPDEVITVDGAELAPKGTLVTLGELTEATYRTTKGGGELTDYVHTFGETGEDRPLLAYDEGFRLFLVGGGYTVTSRGIEG